MHPARCKDLQAVGSGDKEFTSEYLSVERLEDQLAKKRDTHAGIAQDLRCLVTEAETLQDTTACLRQGE